MWKYSKELMDHFTHPRNNGKLDNPDGHSEVGSPQCGDAMTLDIEVDDNDVITDIMFQTFGCAGAIASASALTEIAKGRTLEEAVKIKNSEIVAQLGGMPAEKYHCSVMGHEALTAAVEDFKANRSKLREILRVLIKEEFTDSQIEIVKVHPARIQIKAKAKGAEEVIKQALKKKLDRNIEITVVQ